MNAKNKFFLTHLLVSFFIALIAVIIVFMFWYPSPINKAVGITHIVLMMLVIDVIVGPILGWFVYKVGKKTLKFDLSVIIFIQILALGYGVYSIAQARPTWIVFNVDRFELVRNNEIYKQKITNAKTEFQSPSWISPQYASVKKIEDKKLRNDLMMQEIFSGVSLAQHPELYQSLNLANVQIQNKAQKLNVLNEFNSDGDVKSILAQYPQANVWLPLQTKVVDMVVLINKDKGEVIKIVDLRPWK